MKKLLFISLMMLGLQAQQAPDKAEKSRYAILQESLKKPFKDDVQLVSCGTLSKWGSFAKIDWQLYHNISNGTYFLPLQENHPRILNYILGEPHEDRKNNVEVAFANDGSVEKIISRDKDNGDLHIGRSRWTHRNNSGKVSQSNDCREIAAFMAALPRNKK